MVIKEDSQAILDARITYQGLWINVNLRHSVIKLHVLLLNCTTVLDNLDLFP